MSSQEKHATRHGETKKATQWTKKLTCVCDILEVISKINHKLAKSCRCQIKYFMHSLGADGVETRKNSVLYYKYSRFIDICPFAPICTLLNNALKVMLATQGSLKSASIPNCLVKIGNITISKL